MRGEFIRADGLVLPNNVTAAGRRMILLATFRNTVPSFYFGLVIGTPDLDLVIAGLEEPTVGVNGYARQTVTRDSTGWSGEGLDVSGERYIESAFFTFAASGGDFDKPISRVALMNSGTQDGSELVYSLSSPLNDEITITPTTPLEERRFKYRFYS